MRLLICYDVDTSDRPGAKRLRRIAEACKDYGVRVQYSVFECDIAPADWVVLRSRLLDEFEASRDSLRIYFIDANTRAEHHGVRQPVDVKGPLIV